jgi:hypothetical protein
MIELVLLAAIAAYSCVIGRQLLCYAGVEFATLAGRLSAATSLGLAVVAYAVLAVGLFGLLSVPAVLAAAVPLAALVHAGPIGAVLRPRLLSRTLRPGKSAQDGASSSTSLSLLVPRLRLGMLRLKGTDSEPERRSLWDSASAGGAWERGQAGNIFRAVVVLTAVVGTMIGALAPPTAGDALCYHLEIPKRFVQQGAVSYLPLTDNSVMPFLMEMLYTLSLLLCGPELAQLVHWLVGILLALAAVELAVPFVSKGGSAWVGTIVLLVPGVTNQMTAPLNDLAVALYATWMVHAWTHWNSTGQWRWLALAGFWGGLALSVKLVAAAMVVAVAVALALQCSRRSLAGACRAGMTFAACLCLAGGVWYARSGYHTGNPVYPYFNSFFGGEPHTRSLLRTEHNLWAVPWAATMHPEEFGGRGVQFGAVFLALLPGLALVRRPAGLTPLLGLALGHGLLWFTVRQDLRFLLPVVPILAVAVVVVIRGLAEVQRPSPAAACACLAALLAFQSLIVVKRARPCLAVAVGLQTREDYLAQHEPSYAVARFVNTQLPAGSRLISQDYRGFYFESDFVREAALRRRIPYAERGDALVDALANSGFTHVLLVESHNPNSAIYDQSFRDRLGEAADRLHLVLASHFEVPGGDRRDYRLLELPRTDSTSRTERAGVRAARGIAN